jgi:hypothetical protein
MDKTTRFQNDKKFSVLLDEYHSNSKPQERDRNEFLVKTA